jgi:Zn-dependent peptidase ImmA (M78 family)
MTRVAVEPALLRWACKRARLDPTDLAKRFPKLGDWERGEARPTLKQLDDFARATHTPVGYLFLRELPSETIPIPDYRTVENVHIAQPSPDLLETIYLCEQRQEWYRDFVRALGEEPLSCVGSLAIDADVVSAAQAIRSALGFDVDRRRTMPTWSDALREFIAQADEIGVLVMCSGIVGSNTHRKLDPQEFRGFALANSLAPVIFINGADTRSAQMFTLAHELAHIWLGESALSDTDARSAPDQAVERWCNRVAAELLVPIDLVRREFRDGEGLASETARLSRRFKVSSLVILRRIHDVGGLSRQALTEAYEAEVTRLRMLTTGNGGNFYHALPARVSKRFARALVVSTLEGQTLYRDALRMLGISKMSTFDELGRTLAAYPIHPEIFDRLYTD